MLRSRNKIGARWAALLFPSLTLAAAAVVTVETQPAAGQTPVTPEQTTFFETKIRPVLAENCLSCHGPKMQMAGIRVDTRSGFMKGTDTGKSLVGPKGVLLEALHYRGPIKMPPAGKLKEAVIADFEAWVGMGAPWPQPKKSEGDGKRPLWALAPVKRTAPPRVKGQPRVRQPLDAFILQKLEAKGHTLAPDADRRTLVRRVSYDLTGLPPTFEETAGFLSDSSPNAYEKAVNRLLNSPRFGEKWARHWLDVARYADTKGYVFEEDRNYPNAYTYRNWVIEAFNRDLPYDQFIRQQIAADRLPYVAEGDDKRPLAAMGFLTVGRRFLNQVPDIVDDRIDVVMRGFQGLTVACARCHDHKFDPIPTQDYYSLYSVFVSSNESNEPISDKTVRDPWLKHNAAVAAAESSRNEVVVSQTARLRKLATDPAQLAKPVREALQGIREETTPSGDGLKRIRPGFEASANTKLDQLDAELARLRRTAPPLPEFAMAMKDSPTPGDVRVFRRGNPQMPGDVAPRRFLSALLKPGETRPHWNQGSGRLELANAIASKDNPLTARVFVNRVWHHLFGAGLVRTPSDFGRQGEPPTHPELLDYLASDFMQDQWSVKRLLRKIVLSTTYRQASVGTPKLMQDDPDNRLLGRMPRRRLDLEQTRDSLMMASRQLEFDAEGGKSVDLWKTPFTKRRAVYGFVERQNLPGTFRTFDFASPDSSSPRRFQTTVPQQALFLMNSPFAMEQAKMAAERVVTGKASPEAQVRSLYRQILGRSPDADELQIGLGYLARGALAPPPAPIWSYGSGDGIQFQPMSVFADNMYRPAAKFPDPEWGYLMLTRDRGHPGNSDKVSAVRRWTAPATMTVDVSGIVNHPDAKGNGIRVRVVLNGADTLAAWPVKNQAIPIAKNGISVKKGDRLDFVFEPVGDASFDGFASSITVRQANGAGVWETAAGFGPPPGPAVSRLALLAQALMMTNEFLFVD